jgi:hypothetical protein
LRGKPFYLSQLRNVKLSPLVETYDAKLLSIYAEASGWVLARAREGRRSPDDQRLSRFEGRFRCRHGQICARQC